MPYNIRIREVIEMVSKQKRIDDAIQRTKELFKDDKTGHGEDHTRRVYHLALDLISKSKTDRPNKLTVTLACLRHDWDDPKLFQEKTPFEHAYQFRNEYKLPRTFQSQVIGIIKAVSFKGKDSVRPRTIEGKYVQDADRLDAIGAIGIARAFQYGGSKGRKLYDKEEIINTNPGAEEYQNNTLSTIAHFYQKLLKLKGRRNTKPGREEAEKRTYYRIGFLKELKEEVKEPLYKERH